MTLFCEPVARVLGGSSRTARDDGRDDDEPPLGRSGTLGTARECGLSNDE